MKMLKFKLTLINILNNFILMKKNKLHLKGFNSEIYEQ